jgi:superfamily I DNA and/or RNA helicase
MAYCELAPMDSSLELGRVAELLRIEQREDQAIHELYLKKRSIKDRKEAGLCWFPLKVNETGFGLGAYPFIVVERPVDRHRHQFQSGAPVSLFSAKEGNEDESIHGVIGYVDDSRMKITFHLDELPDWVDEGKIGVNLLFDSKSYDEMFKALSEVINCEKGRLKELKDIILGYKNSDFQNRMNVRSVLLNDSQNKALMDILNAEDVAFVHGPPGTGKTTTLVESILEIIKEEKKIMVTAASNAAVDHLTRSLAARGVNVVRIGNLAKIDEDNSARTMDVLLSADRDFKKIKELKKRAVELRKMGGKYKRSFGREEAEQRKLLFQEAKNINKEARELETYIVDKIIDNAQVVACTLIGSTNEYIRNRRFDVVIIDEAGQALEPACWVPILRAEKVVMAGDPFQLPPTVKSHEADKLGLSKTLLEKGIQRHEKVSLLKVQYRMHKDIMGFSNEKFYNNQLEAHESVGERLLEGHILAAEYIDTAGCGYNEQEGEDGDSRANPEEAQLIRRYIERELTGISQENSIAVISPYRAQIDILDEVFAADKRIVVNTIDSFQGQERDVVLISLVRSNDSGEIGFLKDYRRLNVALTRAKKKLVVFGDSATLASDKFYSDFINYMEHRGAYRTAWEYFE